MCLMVYLGLDAPFEATVAVGEVGLDPEVAVTPPALAAKSVIYRVADRLEQGWNCSCILLSHDLPWEDEPANQETEAAFTQLARLVVRADADGLKPLLFSAWDGDETKAVKLAWRMAPEHLTADRRVFNDLEVAGGVEVPTLVEIDANVREPVRHVL